MEKARTCKDRPRIGGGVLLPSLERGREKLPGHHAHRPEAVLLVLGHLESVEEGGPLPPERLKIGFEDGVREGSVRL